MFYQIDKICLGVLSWGFGNHFKFCLASLRKSAFFGKALDHIMWCWCSFSLEVLVLRLGSANTLNTLKINEMFLSK